MCIGKDTFPVQNVYLFSLSGLPLKVLLNYFQLTGKKHMCQCFLPEK